MDNNNNNSSSEDSQAKLPPEIEVDPVTGKITIKENSGKNNSQKNNKDNKSNKESGSDKNSQNRKRLIEPNHSPDEIDIEEEKDKKQGIMQAIANRLMGSQAKMSKKNLDIAQNIGERMNKLGVKFLGHLSSSKASQLSPNNALDTQKTSKDKGNDRNI